MSRKKNLKFGIELEYSILWDDFKPIASNAIKDVYGWCAYYARESNFNSDENTHRWHIKVDGFNQSELTSPISQFSDLEKIRLVVKKIGKIKVIENDGFHVHVDIGDVDIYHLLSMWLACEKEIFNCFPKSRQNNVSCMRLIDKSYKNKWLGEILPDIMEKAHGRSICFVEHNKRNTVEFRVAEGTTDPDFVVCWIKFLLAFVDSVKLTNPCLSVCVKPNSLTFYDLLENLELDAKTEEIMKKRYEKYKVIKKE